MIKELIVIVLKNTSFFKNSYQIQEYFESLKYKVFIQNDQIYCEPTLLKKISSGGSFWIIDYFLIDLAGEEAVIRVKLSKVNLALIFMLHLIAMLVFYIRGNMPFEAMLGFFGVLLALCTLLIILSLSEIKKEVKSIANS